MKKLLITLLATLVFLLPIHKTFAHIGGVPIIKINGKSTNIYTQEQGLLIGDIVVPGDIAPEAYLRNSRITFEVDKNRLQYAEEIIDQALFTWDFGDGSKQTGEKVMHSYTKIGSYTVTLTINLGDLRKFGLDPEFTPPITTQNLLIHITPSMGYKVPKAIITIDNKQIRDPQNDKVEFSFRDIGIGPLKFNKTFAFDASNSESQEEIVSYVWDLDGNEKTLKKDKSFTYSYREEWFMYEPKLRITDKNGFVADTFVTLINKNKELDEGGNPANTNVLLYLLIGNATLILCGILTYFLIKKEKQKK